MCQVCMGETSDSGDVFLNAYTNAVIFVKRLEATSDESKKSDETKVVGELSAVARIRENGEANWQPDTTVNVNCCL